MSDRQNHHSRERTQTVAVREELDRALASSVPPKQRTEVLAKIEQIVERYSSPYPDSDWLTDVEALAPGITREIVQASIDDMRSRRQLEGREIDVQERELVLVDNIAKGEQKSTREGRYIGFAAYIACYMFSGVMYSIHAEGLAYAAFGAASLGIVGQLIRGGSSSSVTISAEKHAENDDGKGKQVTKSS